MKTSHQTEDNRDLIKPLTALLIKRFDDVDQELAAITNLIKAL